MEVLGNNFQAYLRGEVETAGQRFEQVKEKVLGLTEQDMKPGPELLGATQELREAVGAYVNALRRLANYSAHGMRVEAPIPMTAHA